MVSWMHYLKVLIALCIVTLATGRAHGCEISGGHTALKPAHWYTIDKAPFRAEAELDHLWVRMTISGEDHSLPAWSDGQGKFEFIIPADYVNPWHDKPIENFWLTDGEYGCELTGLSQTAMEPAPSGIGISIIQVAGEYQALAAELGYPVEEIEGITRGMVPPENQPVMHIIHASWALFKDYTDIYEKASPEERHLLRVMGAYLTMSEGADNQNYRSEVNQDLFEWHKTKASAGKETLQFYPMQSSSWSNIPKLFVNEVTRKPEFDYTIPTSAEQLSIQMKKQTHASLVNGMKFTDRYRKQHDTKYIGAMRDVAGTLLGLGSTLGNQAGGSGKGVAFVYSRWSEWLFLQAFTDKLVGALYPAEFVSIEAVGGPYDLYTDADPSKGAITALNVVTRSKGGISLQQMFGEVVNQFFPYNKALGKASGKAAGLAKRISSPLIKKLPASLSKTVKLKMLSKNAISASQAVAPARELIEHVSRQLMAQRLGDKQDVGDFKSTDIKPQTFPAVNILEKDYYQANIDTKSIVDFTADDNVIRFGAKSKGHAQIDFQTFPGKWGSNNIRGSQIVKVNPQNFFLFPKTISVVPGERTKFSMFLKKSVGESSKKDDFLISFADPGFEIYDVFGPFVKGEGEEKWEQWVVYVDSSISLASYPSPFGASFKTDVALQDEGMFQSGNILPERMCIDHGETELFIFADHLGRPMPGITWEIDGPGSMTPTGVYTAPLNSESGQFEVIAKSRSGDRIISRKSFTLGCACAWRLNVDGQKSSGEKLSAAAMAFGPVSNVTIMTLDNRSGSVALTGEGHILGPKYISPTVQQGDTTFVSGLPVNVNIGSLSGQAGCQTAETDILRWTVENGRWLSGHVGGSLTTAEELASGCVKSLVPYDFEFMVDLGENVDITERVMADIESGKIRTDSAEFDSLLKSVSSQAGNISACFSD